MIRDTSFFFFAVKATVAFVVFYNTFKVNAFAPSTISSSSSSSRSSPTICTDTNTNSESVVYSSNHKPLFAGMGMGMGATKSKQKKGGKNKNKEKKAPFDINASILRLDKKYDELLKTNAKKVRKDEDDIHSSYASGEIEMITSEYVIAARDSSKKGSVPDWVPIAQLCLKRPETQYLEGAADALVTTAISNYCRELSYLAAKGAPVFSTLARNEIQYSVESTDNFHKFVYDEVMEGKKTKSADQAMTKAVARDTLGLLKDGEDAVTEITKSDIKQAYRKLSFELHPDRFKGTPEECVEAANRFGRVQLAYETLNSGVREEGKSWYESLGGRERMGFVGPVNLLPLAAAQENMTRHKAEGGLCALDPTMVQSFVTRHLRSA